MGSRDGQNIRCSTLQLLEQQKAVNEERSYRDGYLCWVKRKELARGKVGRERWVPTACQPSPSGSDGAETPHTAWGWTQDTGTILMSYASCDYCLFCLCVYAGIRISHWQDTKQMHSGCRPFSPNHCTIVTAVTFRGQSVKPHWR